MGNGRARFLLCLCRKTFASKDMRRADVRRETPHLRRGFFYVLAPLKGELARVKRAPEGSPPRLAIHLFGTHLLGVWEMGNGKWEMGNGRERLATPFAVLGR